MKKSFLLMGIIPILLISCAVNKNALRIAYNTPPTDDEKYFGPTNSLSEKAALAMIGTFPKHKDRVFHNRRLDSAWTQFGVQTLRDILTNANVDSFKIFLAVNINPDDAATFRLPTVVLQIKLNATTTTAISKGSSSVLAQYQYLSSSQLCPPPRGDCKVKPQ